MYRISSISSFNFIMKGFFCKRGWHDGKILFSLMEKQEVKITVKENYLHFNHGKQVLL